MRELFEVEKQDGRILSIRLKDAALFDAVLVDAAAADDNCLNLMVRSSIRFDCDISGLVRLSDFLAQYSFERLEGYAFFDNLFERALASSRGKPLVYDADLIFTDPHGTEFRFLALPLVTDAWLLQAESIREWVRNLAKCYRTKTSFEVPGFLNALANTDDFSLPAVLSGLRDLRHLYYPRRLRFLPERPPEPFRAAKEVRPKHVPVIEEPELPEELEKTQILAELPESGACLMLDGERWNLPFESMVVGRGMQCDVRIPNPDVSVTHAKITRSQDRYYIADLHSSNGTYLDGRPVQRRMRLKDGMKVRLGQTELLFCQ